MEIEREKSQPFLYSESENENLLIHSTNYLMKMKIIIINDDDC